MNVLNRKLVKNVITNVIKIKELNKMQQNSIWAYVDVAFNRVDAERLQQVGPDRLCAEWLLKNGGAIHTVEAPNRHLKDYNALPSENNRFHLKIVDATGSCIMKIGLEHFKGCNQIDTVIFHECKHLESDALQGLIYLKNTLKLLQVSSCDNISDDGLMSIGELNKLDLLKIFEMRYVKDMSKVKEQLMTKLPNCHMDIH